MLEPVNFLSNTEEVQNSASEAQTIHDDNKKQSSSWNQYYWCKKDRLEIITEFREFRASQKVWIQCHL